MKIQQVSLFSGVARCINEKRKNQQVRGRNGSLWFVLQSPWLI